MTHPDCEWGVEQYGKLLSVGGGKERMTAHWDGELVAAMDLLCFLLRIIGGGGVVMPIVNRSCLGTYLPVGVPRFRLNWLIFIVRWEK